MRFFAQSGRSMRFFGNIVGGSSVETASFFVNRSLTSRMLLLGLPLLAAVLALLFFVTGGVSQISSIAQ